MTSRMHKVLTAELAELPLLDVHSHLSPNRAALSGPAQLLSYHMLQYPLRAADGGELDPEVLSFGRNADPDAVCEQWERHGQAVMDTGFGVAFQAIMHDLYGFRGPLTRKGLRRLAGAMKERTADPGWPDAVFDRLRLETALTSAIGLAPKRGSLAGRMVPTVESGVMGTHEPLSWQKSLTWMERRFGRSITGRDDMELAIREYFHDYFKWPGVRVFVSWVSTLADFRPTTTAEVDRLIQRCREGTETLTRAEIGLLVAEQIRAMVRAVSDRVAVCQLCFGCQYIQPGTAHPLARAFPEFIHSLGHLIAEFPGLHFNLLNAVEDYEPPLCAMVQAYSNVSLGGYWWHMFYPTVMENAWHRRLDMVPATRLMAFFSDGYCVDHVYGRATMTRAVLARVMASRIERGLCTRKTASRLAQEILVDTPRRIMLGGAS
jgi:hypothetical protein